MQTIKRLIGLLLGVAMIGQALFGLGSWAWSRGAYIPDPKNHGEYIEASLNQSYVLVVAGCYVLILIFGAVILYESVHPWLPSRTKS